MLYIIKEYQSIPLSTKIEYFNFYMFYIIKERTLFYERLIKDMTNNKNELF